MSKEKDVVCPSGLSGRVRGLKGREFKLLSDRKQVKSGAAYQGILEGCWLTTDDDGQIYEFGGDRPKWGDVLIGDRMFLFIQIRLASYPGEDYDFRITCDGCGEPINWSVDLAKLPVQQLPAESAELFKNGNRFPFKIGEHQGHFKLMTGKDERRTAKLIKPNEVDFIGLLKERILDLDGKEGSHDIEKILEDLDADEHRDLLDTFDLADCGVETSFDVICSECGDHQEVELPFDRSFFMPGKERTARRRDRSSSFRG